MIESRTIYGAPLLLIAVLHEVQARTKEYHSAELKGIGLDISCHAKCIRNDKNRLSYVIHNTICGTWQVVRLSTWAKTNDAQQAPGRHCLDTVYGGFSTCS